MFASATRLSLLIIAATAATTGALRRKINKTNVTLQNRGCEWHTEQLRPGWKIKCGWGLDRVGSNCQTVGNQHSLTSSPVELQIRCEELSWSRCDGFSMMQNIGRSSGLFRQNPKFWNSSSSGLCFKKTGLWFTWQAVYYKESMPVREESECPMSGITTPAPPQVCNPAFSTGPDPDSNGDCECSPGLACRYYQVPPFEGPMKPFCFSSQGHSTSKYDIRCKGCKCEKDEQQGQ